MREGVDVETVLVPVDGSEAAETATEYAVAVADRYGAAVHAVYVLGEEASRAIERGEVDADVAAEEARSVLAGLGELAGAAGVPFGHSTAVGYSTTRKLVHPGSVILDAAEQLDADFVVVPRETGTAEEDVLEKAAEYVLSYASQPVLSV